MKKFKWLRSRLSRLYAPFPIHFYRETESRRMYQDKYYQTNDTGSMFYKMINNMPCNVFEEVAYISPHTFMIPKFAVNYLSEVDSNRFTKILEFGADIFKDYMILKKFLNKQIDIYDVKDLTIEYQSKILSEHMSPCNITLSKFDLLKDDWNNLARNHYDSLFFFQMESGFSDEELKKFAHRVYDIGIKDILILSPSIITLNTHPIILLSYLIAHLKYFKINSKEFQTLRNIKALLNCFVPFKLECIRKYYTYTYPYYLLHLTR